MRWFALALLALSALLPAGASAQATLNKCVDAEGKVTYSNLPCRNAREALKVEIDPAPTPDPVRPQPAPQQAPVAPVAPAAPTVPAAAPAPAVPATPSASSVPVIPKMPAAPTATKAPVISIEPASKYIEAQPTPAIKLPERASASQCNALSEQLGRILDKMDAARRVGATQEQMNTWNSEIKELERKKQQSGCF